VKHVRWTRNDRRVRVGLTIERYREIEPAVILGLVRLLGLEYVEITRSVFDDLERVVSKMDRMQCGFHLPIVCENGWDFATPSARAEIDRLIGLINRHKNSLRLRHAICHPPEPGEDGHLNPESVQYLFSNLRRLELPVYIENIPRLSVEDYEAFYRRAREELGDRIAGMCFDGPHYLISGVDPLSALAAFDGEIGCIHLSDCTDSEDSHLPFGRGGAMPIERILEELKKRDFRGVINLEIRPEDFHDVFPTIESYLRVLRVFRPAKYVSARARVALLYPLLRRVLA